MVSMAFLFFGGKMKLLSLTLLLLSNSVFATTLEGQKFFETFIMRDPIVEQSNRDPEHNTVTQKFGKLQVKIGSEMYESTKTPWSSWWFPSRETYLFDRDNTLAPLEIYDQVHRRVYGNNPQTAFYERTNLYSDNSANWSGLCHAWAMASIVHPEPTKKIYKNGYYFTPGDQKALILKSYENMSGFTAHGQRFDGGPFDLYEDMYPDQLHKVVQVFLRDKKLPFLMDYDPSYPVWTVPVYKAKVVISEINSTSVKVSMWLTYASSFVDSPEYIGTKSVTKVYRYLLTGSYDNQKVFTATGGKWTDESIVDHPDYIIEYPENIKRGSMNKNLNIDHLDQILGL